MSGLAFPAAPAREQGPNGVLSMRPRPDIHSNNGDSCRVADLGEQGIAPLRIS